MKKKMIFFLIIVGLLTYTYFKVIQTYPYHQIGMIPATVLFFMMMIGWLLLHHSNPDLVERRWFRVLAWIGSLTMGFWTTFILLSIPIDIAFLMHYLMQIALHTTSFDPGPLAILHQRTDFFLLVLSGCFVGVGFIEALRAPCVKKVAIAMHHLPPELNGVTIAQISDLHVGPTIRQRYVDKVVRLTNATKPDFIFITGDIADATAESIELHLQPLAQLKSRFGVYYVTGNHEYYWGIEGWINKIKQLGFMPLINENIVIHINGVNVLIAGVTDHIGGQFHESHQPDLKKAVQSDELTQFKILLAHRPDACFAAEQLGFDLQFSGHTHAGQFFPFNILLPFVYKYYRRSNHHGNLWLYVNPGTGYWGPANRLGIPAEITLLTLHLL